MMITADFLKVVARKNAGGAIPWTPAEITTAVWYDAADADTITESGGAVSQWDDKSGNSNHAVQGTGAEQPTTGTTSLNTLNTIYFDGTESMDFTTALTTVRQVVFVVQNGDGEETSGTTNAHIYGNTAGSQYTFIVVNSADGSYDISIDGTVSASGGARFNGDTRYTGTNIDLGNTNAQNEGPGIWAVDYNANSQVGHLARGFSAREGIVEIAEILFFTSILSDSDRQKLEGYLAWKWGLEGSLASGHPYESAAPTV
jgi:hypothetical protein